MLLTGIEKLLHCLTVLCSVSVVKAYWRRRDSSVAIGSRLMNSLGGSCLQRETRKTSTHTRSHTHECSYTSAERLTFNLYSWAPDAQTCAPVNVHRLTLTASARQDDVYYLCCSILHTLLHTHTQAPADTLKTT